MNLPPSVTPGRVLRWYLAFAITGILLTVALIIIVVAWPAATPLVFATLFSAALVMAYLAWRMTKR